MIKIILLFVMLLVTTSSSYEIIIDESLTDKERTRIKDALYANASYLNTPISYGKHTYSKSSDSGYSISYDEEEDEDYSSDTFTPEQARAAWQEIKYSNKSSDFYYFISQYPDSRYTNEAKIKAKKISQGFANSMEAPSGVTQ